MHINAERKKTLCHNYIRWQFKLQYSTPTVHTYTLVSFLHSENTRLCGCHSNPEANNSPKPILPEVEEARAENCPNQICPTVYRFSLPPRHTETLYLFTNTRYTAPSLQLPPILHPTWRRDSIINQFTSCERHPPEEGNEQWQMKDIGKQLLAATVGGCAPRHHLVCSWQRKQIAFFACAWWWIRDSEDEERWWICTVWVCCLCRMLNNKWHPMGVVTVTQSLGEVMVGLKISARWWYVLH